MNRKLVLAIVAATIAAGNAFADDDTIDTTPFVSTKSRAEVQAELARPYQGAVSPWSPQYNQLTEFKSRLTRAQVQAEYIAAREEVAAMNGEDSGSAYLARRMESQVNRTRLAGQPLNAQ
ncbi:MAG TPA: DUF4148 domain-containing protein [Burkholderiaceae bacterium]|nr:DUF4148 domain-containing protein [Burkholderiaceae bacterium]